jgi:hypothetical protein
MIRVLKLQEMESPRQTTVPSQIDIRDIFNLGDNSGSVVSEQKLLRHLCNTAVECI